ncbi:hypothetical protein MANES_08G099111v8 [Manihot esculenta]|uniref:Uncharacterized protein n=1 Tax=Manihot esculenta TaxID=3983 RepID=A0ACB7HAF8_MANES|nr:hypothetical protein MANES_08G099111v8 [Manihot esculenta]
MKEINNFKKRLSLEFEVKDLGAVKRILGMRISWDRSIGILNLSQEQYIEKVLFRFRVDDVKPRSMLLANHLKFSKEQSPKTAMECDHMAKVLHYASAVGSLMCARVCSRPNIAHAVGVVSRYISNPVKKHWEAKCVSISSTETEYIAVAEAENEIIWLTNYLEELDKKQLDNVLFTNSESAIQLVKNPVYHFTRSLVEECEMCLKKIESTKNLADILSGIDEKCTALFFTVRR